MRYDPAVHQRRSVRLPGYDYAQAGAYCVTICAYQRRSVFGAVVGEEVVLNRWGEVVAKEWERSAAVRRGVEMDAFVVMPNHVHGIVVITGGTGDGDVGAHCVRPVCPSGACAEGARSAPLRRSPASLASFVAGVKSAVTKRINGIRGGDRTAIWQRNYYEHVIRDEGDLEEIRRYIAENPTHWAEDRENPAWSAGARMLRRR